MRLQLDALNHAEKPEDLTAPGWRLHPLKGDMAGYWAIVVNGNWRLVFRFSGSDTELIDYKDYH